MAKAYYHWQGSTLILSLHLQPKAARDEFVGIHGDRLKIRVTAAPIEGKANKHLTKFLAKQFKVPLKQVSITSGELGRQKTIQIENPSRLPLELDITKD